MLPEMMILHKLNLIQYTPTPLPCQSKCDSKFSFVSLTWRIYNPFQILLWPSWGGCIKKTWLMLSMPMPFPTLFSGAFSLKYIRAFPLSFPLSFPQGTLPLLFFLLSSSDPSFTCFLSSCSKAGLLLLPLWLFRVNFSLHLSFGSEFS